MREEEEEEKEDSGAGAAPKKKKGLHVNICVNVLPVLHLNACSAQRVALLHFLAY